jgi:hypothetical protein
MDERLRVHYTGMPLCMGTAGQQNSPIISYMSQAAETGQNRTDIYRTLSRVDSYLTQRGAWRSDSSETRMQHTHWVNC